MRKKDQNKGIFCLEGLWDPDLRVMSTVRPLLELLRLNEGVDYIHREFATAEEFELYLGKWTQKRYEAYPVLYLASHGLEEGIQIAEERYSLDRMAELLEGRCENRVILFASCSTLNIEARSLRRFLSRTGALAACGYRVDVGWMRATAFELLLLARMQENEFSLRGIDSIARSARSMARSFRDLEFRILRARSSS